MGEVYIRSQDREMFYCFGTSFNALKYVEYESFGTGGVRKRHVICIFNGGVEERKRGVCVLDNRLEVIGVYESKERCIEIIDEIQEVCGQYLYASGNSGFTLGSTATPPMAAVIPRVYRMPEK